MLFGFDDLHEEDRVIDSNWNIRRELGNACFEQFTNHFLAELITLICFGSIDVIKITIRSFDFILFRFLPYTVSEFNALQRTVCDQACFVMEFNVSIE